MFLTKKQLETIAQQIASISVKDSDFEETFAAKYGDSVAIVQDGINKRIDLSELGMYFASVSGELIPDNEDITVRDGALSFADRSDSHGKGYIILRRDKTFAEQVVDENTIYEIRYNFDLDGGSVTIPTDCVLKFNGGSLSNGTVVGTNTVIQADAVKIFGSDLTISGTWRLDKAYPEWFGAVADNTTDCTAAMQKSLDYFHRLTLIAGEYRTTHTLFINAEHTVISGVSYTKSSIVKNYSGGDTLNAVIACSVNNVGYIDVRDVRVAASARNVDYGFHFNGIHESRFENIYIYQCKIGFCSDDNSKTVWNLTMTRVVFFSNTNRRPDNDNPYGYESGTYGFKIVTVGGTALLMQQCWVRDGVGYGYYLEGLKYSSMVSCGVDSLVGTPYYLKGMGLTMTSCAMEMCYSSAFITVYSSNIVINSFSSNLLWAATASEIYMLFGNNSSIILNASVFVDYNETYYVSGTKYGLCGNTSTFIVTNSSAPDSAYLPSSVSIKTISGSSIVTRTGQVYNKIYTGAANSGELASKPTLTSGEAGFMYFDTTNNRPIYWTGSAWVDASGETA